MNLNNTSTHGTTSTPTHGTVDIYPDAVFIDGHRINVDRVVVADIVVGVVDVRIRLTADTITLHTVAAPAGALPEPIDF
jgi:hypothetical protein